VLAFDTIYARDSAGMSNASPRTRSSSSTVSRPIRPAWRARAALAIRQEPPPDRPLDLGTITEIAVTSLACRAGGGDVVREVQCPGPRHSVDSVLEAILGAEEGRRDDLLRIAPAPGRGGRALGPALSRDPPRARSGEPRLARLTSQAARTPHADRVLVDRSPRAHEPDAASRALELRGRGSGSVDVTRASDRALVLRRTDLRRVRPLLTRSRDRALLLQQPLRRCPDCRGFGNILTFTLERVVPTPQSVLDGALDRGRTLAGLFPPS